MTAQPAPACPPARVACWVTLFVTVSNLGILLAVAWAQGVGLLDPELALLHESTFYVVFYVHIWVALYDGCFSRLRRATWPALIGAAFALQAAEFLGPSLAGPFHAWLAAALAGWPVSADAALGILAAAPSALLLLDVVALQDQALGRPRLTTWSGWPAAVAAALALLGAQLLWFGLPHGAAPHGPEFRPEFRIVPPWHSLPYYAMLRSVPDKLVAVAIVALALALAAPLAWLWAGAAWCRIGPARHAYQAMCAGLAAAWLLMGWSGGHFPDPQQVALGGLGTACYFAYFVATPVLARWSRRRTPQTLPVDEARR